MNNKFVIVAESSCDLDHQYCIDNNIVITAFNFSLEDKNYRHYFDEREMTNKEFYNLIEKGGVFKTTLVNVEQHTETLEPLLKQGYDVLAISLSSALSGTFNCLRMACELLEETYPDRKIIAIDSLSASMGQGLLVVEAAKQKAAGKTVLETANFVNKNIMSTNQNFWIPDLQYLARGGRFGAGAPVPPFKPILVISKSGKLEMYKRFDNQTEAIEGLVNELAVGHFNPKMEVAVAHANNKEAAELLIKTINNKYPDLKIRLTAMGPLVGSHVGPGTLGLFFFGDERSVN